MTGHRFRVTLAYELFCDRCVQKCNRLAFDGHFMKCIICKVIFCYKCFNKFDYTEQECFAERIAKDSQAAC